MKKILAIALTLVMLFACTAFAAESADFVGDWYGSMYGAVLVITMNEDGTYIIDMSSMDAGTMEGTWEFDGANIVMDKGTEAESAFAYDEAANTFSYDVMVFGREPIEAFVAYVDYNGTIVALYDADGDGFYNEGILPDGTLVSVGDNITQGDLLEMANGEGYLSPEYYVAQNDDPTEDIVTTGEGSALAQNDQPSGEGVAATAATAVASDEDEELLAQLKDDDDEEEIDDEELLAQLDDDDDEEDDDELLSLFDDSDEETDDDQDDSDDDADADEDED